MQRPHAQGYGPPPCTKGTVQGAPRASGCTHKAGGSTLSLASSISGNSQDR